MSQIVLVEQVGGTQVVTLNRPDARNALTRASLDETTAAFAKAADDPAVRCVVLTGAGGHFCAGADLRAHLEGDPAMLEHMGDLLTEFHRLVKAIVRCPKPTIAMMDGAAVGFGADLALGCDLRVASSRAYVQEKFVSIGLMPDGGGTFWLPRLVGTAKAMQMILLAEKVEAGELLSLGLVMKVVDADALRAETLAIARSLEVGPPLAFAAIKRSLYASWGPFEDALAREREEQVKLLRSHDAMEGVIAWMERRPARFEGK